MVSAADTSPKAASLATPASPDSLQNTPATTPTASTVPAAALPLVDSPVEASPAAPSDASVASTGLMGPCAVPATVYAPSRNPASASPTTCTTMGSKED
ncbi:hypothetical protein ZWY2020_019173 [Hordeum vulgare]|nr:hypothetical protein ZWY2020_019173 [Hordeum vulgare]